MVALGYLGLVALFVGKGCCNWVAGPSFLDAAVNVTVPEGAHAFLPCRVANLADRSVTWLRRRNLHIITAGLLTYSPDDRYRVLHPANTEEWTLHIRSVQPNDGGWYECQVNSHPKITRPILLTVHNKSLADPFYKHELEKPRNGTAVHIQGPNEVHIQTGSVLAMTCTVDHWHHPGPQQVSWYQGAARLHYDNPRGGIALKTEKTLKRTVSRLMLAGVTSTDSGRYTCRPDTGGTAAVTVHVMSGQQQQAAVQQSGNSLSPCLGLSPLSLLLHWALTHWRALPYT